MGFATLKQDLENQVGWNGLGISSPEWFKVVAHTKTGELKYGLCNTLETDGAGAEIILHDKQGNSLNRRTIVPFSSLKALFVVKHFEGTNSKGDDGSVPMPRNDPVAVEFQDGEVLVGRPMEPGWNTAGHFLLRPEDTGGNNTLVVVERSSIKQVYNRESYRQKQQQEFNAFTKVHFKPGETQDECMGDYYFSKHDYAKAAEHYKKVIEQSPANAQVIHKLCAAKYNIGVRNIKQRDYYSALHYMELVLKLDPQHKEALEKAEKLRERLRVHEALSDVHSHMPNCMDSMQLKRFIDSGWIYQHHHFILTGPARSGKTRIACSLGHKVSKKGINVVYRRLPTLIDEINAAKAEGADVRLMKSLETADFLIFDDWRHDLMERERALIREIILERYLRRATLFIAELPENQWHHLFGKHAVTDPVLNKVLHDAHKIHLASED